MLIILAGLIVASFLLLQPLSTSTRTVTELDYKTFINYLESNRIQTFEAAGLDVHGTLTNGSVYRTEIPNRDTVLAQQIVKHVRGTVRFESAAPNTPLTWALTFLPLCLVAVLIMVILGAARRNPPN